jgi:hypothetical protein
VLPFGRVDGTTSDEQYKWGACSMTIFTDDLKADAHARMLNWRTRASEAPIWAGHFWPKPPVRDEQHHKYPWGRHGHNLKNNVPEIISIALAKPPRRIDFTAAKDRFPIRLEALSSLEQALAQAGYVFPEDDDSIVSSNNTVCVRSLHEFMLRVVSPPCGKYLRELTSVAYRMSCAAQAAIECFVLAVRGNSNAFRNRTYKLIPAGNEFGYKLTGLNEFSTIGQYANTPQLREPGIVKIGSNLPDIINIWAHPELVQLTEQPVVCLPERRISHDDEKLLAAILADMRHQGHEFAILETENGPHTISLGGVKTLEEASAAVFAAAGLWKWRTYLALRPVPEPRIVQRFVFIDRKLVGNAPLQVGDENMTGRMSVVDIQKQPGRLKEVVTSVNMIDLPKACFKLADDVLALLPECRREIAVDIALSGKGPALCAIHDAFDVEWPGMDEKSAINSLKNHIRQPKPTSDDDFFLEAFSLTED